MLRIINQKIRNIQPKEIGNSVPAFLFSESYKKRIRNVSHFTFVTKKNGGKTYEQNDERD